MMRLRDLRALTLVGLPRKNPEPDPLAVLHLDNRLYIFLYSGDFLVFNNYSALAVVSKENKSLESVYLLI